ncbi:serine/threonine-protein kinase [Paractinoplanes rishiriensis]|uniref:non-specific serine/threonine protein kinase n=1 Tax=Paractinoplanes rishiriensis TaxID=1050105 RepID=A0A919MTR8_9ACTN|nr:serine/threonine-protein kinase [Actinoplanes rishiriensis]GIE94569.1 hypothetical protein Ari01nite_20340 [Actinoplanes rishiriensis]
MSDDWPSAGTLLATRYRLVTLLETGGMAEIWHARDELLGRPVAIKLPTGPQVAWREARMAAKLSHPNIAAVHDYREAVRSDGTVAPFVVMELLAGETVAARLERETFEWPEAARVGAAVADALAAAHASGVVHRDIKPGNVMLTPNGVKILDFGISAAAGEPDDDDTGSTFGTPAYVAPERLDGMPAEPATDVYGLGVLLFEMVTGDPPYPVDTWEELAEARKSGPGTMPDTLPEPFRAVVDRCLDEDPNERPGADQIRFDLTALWLADQPDGEPAEDPATGAPVVLPVLVPVRQRGDGADGWAAVDTDQVAILERNSEDAAAVVGGRPATGRPRSAFTDVTRGQRHTPGSRPTAMYPPGRSVVSGTAPTATVALITPAPKRRMALVLSVLAILVAVGGAYAVVNRPRERVEAGPTTPPPPSGTVPTPLYTVVPPVAPTTAPSTKPSAAPSAPSPKPSETISYNDAFSRLQAAIQAGKDSGEIRPDIATDLFNFVQPLADAKAGNIDAQLQQLRNKIADRAGEGALNPAQATVIRARVADLERAAGM